jgi:hypothetical protein
VWLGEPGLATLHIFCNFRTEKLLQRGQGVTVTVLRIHYALEGPGPNGQWMDGLAQMVKC